MQNGVILNTMKDGEIQELTASFEKALKRVDDVEFMSARDLMPLLDYGQWRNFDEVIQKAKIACRNSGNSVEDHFADASKMVDLGSGATRPVEDFHLTRYACYLIAQNGDPRKTRIAFAM